MWWWSSTIDVFNLSTPCYMLPLLTARPVEYRFRRTHIPPRSLQLGRYVRFGEWFATHGECYVTDWNTVFIPSYAASCANGVAIIGRIRSYTARPVSHRFSHSRGLAMTAILDWTARPMIYRFFSPSHSTSYWIFDMIDCFLYVIWMEFLQS